MTFEIDMFEVLAKIPDDDVGAVAAGYEAVQDPDYLKDPCFLYFSIYDCLKHPDPDGFSVLFVSDKNACAIFYNALIAEGVEAKIVPI